MFGAFTRPLSDISGPPKKADQSTESSQIPFGDHRVPLQA